jgi:peptidyl-prolyl cis-trans isomerase SurA
MRTHLRFILVVLGLPACFCSSSSGADSTNTVDKIAVVVGDQVILASELANQLQLAAFQSGQRPQTEAEIRQFQKQVLEQMISDQLFLAEAKKDTSITVRPSEVQQALDEHIARVVENFGSEDKFIAALEQEGMTLRDLRRQYEQDIENNLLRQRFIQKKLYDVSVSRVEVEKFFEEFKDSIPDQPEGVRLAHILLEITPSGRIEDSVKAEAERLRQLILDGADFAAVSTEHSSLGAGVNGGDLGYMESGDLVPEFARAAFKLEIGEVSGVVRTEFGYHVIKCEGKRGDKAHLRHLLLAVQPSSEDTVRTQALADSLIAAIQAGQDFAEIAKAYSRDDNSRAQGGELGWFALQQMPEGFAEAVTGWTTAGEVRGPVKSRFGLHILKLLEYQPGKALSLDEDFDRIKELARQDKTGRMVDKWIADLKSRTFVEYRLEGFGE